MKRNFRGVLRDDARRGYTARLKAAYKESGNIRISNSGKTRLSDLLDQATKTSNFAKVYAKYKARRNSLITKDLPRFKQHLLDNTKHKTVVKHLKYSNLLRLYIINAFHLSNTGQPILKILTAILLHHRGYSIYYRSTHGERTSSVYFRTRAGIKIRLSDHDLDWGINHEMGGADISINVLKEFNLAVKGFKPRNKDNLIRRWENKHPSIEHEYNLGKSL